MTRNVYGCKLRIPIISNLCQFATRQDLACGRSGSNFSTQVMTSNGTDKDQTSNSGDQTFVPCKTQQQSCDIVSPVADPDTDLKEFTSLLQIECV